MKICPKPLVIQMKRFNAGRPFQFKQGFTLYELLVSIAIIGVLATIITPSWLHLANSTCINTAQNTVFQAIRTAQDKAKIGRIPWNFGIREINGIVQWAVYQSATTPPESLWNNLDTKIRLDNETSLKKVGNTYQVQFNHRGAVNGQLGRLTLSIRGDDRMKRCVIVSTLLGAIRQGTNQPKPRDGKSCY